MMKSILKNISYILLVMIVLFTQNISAQTSPDYIFGSDNGAGWNWATGTQGTASLGSSYKWQFVSTATSDHYFKLGETISTGDGSGFWYVGSGTDILYNGAGAKWSAAYHANMNDAGAFYFSVATGNYYVIKSKLNGSAADFAVFNNGVAAPVTINSVARVIVDAKLTVSATLNTVTAADEKVWVRYSTDNWTTSSTTELTFTSGTTYSAMLSFSDGDFVSYYFYSTIQQVTAPAAADADFFTINFNNNSGKNYSVQIGALNGNYYIPQGTNVKGYSNLANAITNINEGGLNGTVYIYIDDNLSEIGANVLLNRSDLSATNNLIIKPALSKTPVITITGCTATLGATQYAGVTLSGTSYVTIDGSNTVGGTTKDLTFLMNDATNGRNIIQLYGNCDNVSVINTNLSYQTPMSTANTTRGIYVNGQATGAADNFLTKNCNIGDATNTPYYALGITGSSTGSIYCTNVTITNNVVYGRIRPVYLFYVGTSGTTSEISNNYIYTYGGNNATTTYTIFYNTWAGTLNIFNNRLPVMRTNNAVTSGVFGISGLISGTGAACNIYNNFIGGDLAFTGAGVPTVISLMYIQDNGIYQIYHNTFNYPSVTNATERSCIHISGATSNVTLKNNIVINNTDAANAYCIWKSNGTLTSDYNDLYVSGTTANVGFVGAAAKHTLANWQAAGFSYDTYSRSVPVNFGSSTDLHLVGLSIGDLNLSGISGLGVLTDIDGETRFAAFPYIGADEATTPLPVELTSFSWSFAGSDVILSWKTATEINSYMFQVERIQNSKDNGEVLQNWIKVGEVAANGNSNSEKNYSFADQNLAAGKYSYRLKMIDNDGSFKYSQILNADISAPLNYVLEQNYPNPFNPTTTISYSIPVEDNVKITIYTATGEQVLELVNEVQTAGNHLVNFNAAGLASGVYFYRLESANFNQIKKMVLMK